MQGTPQEDLSVQILAIDRGTPPLTSTVTINVTLTDINDFAPQFSQASYTTTILSSAPVNTSLITLEATDRDGVDNMITYSILDDTEGSDNTTTISFSIDSEGVVRNEERFPSLGDREVRTSIQQTNASCISSFIVYELIYHSLFLLIPRVLIILSLWLPLTTVNRRTSTPPPPSPSPSSRPIISSALSWTKLAIMSL